MKRKPNPDPMAKVLAELEGALERIRQFNSYNNVPSMVKLDLARQQVHAAARAVEGIAYPVLLKSLQETKTPITEAGATP